MGRPPTTPLLDVLVSLLISLVVLAAVGVWASVSSLAPNELAALVTAPDVVARLGGTDDSHLRTSVRRSRRRGGGVELSYNGLSPGQLRVVSRVRIETSRDDAVATFARWTRDGLANTGYELPETTRPCDFVLGLGDEASCVVLVEDDLPVGGQLVVRVEDRLLIVLIVGAWFDRPADVTEVLTPHLDAMMKLEPFQILDG